MQEEMLMGGCVAAAEQLILKAVLCYRMNHSHQAGDLGKYFSHLGENTQTKHNKLTLCLDLHDKQAPQGTSMFSCNL